VSVLASSVMSIGHTRTPNPEPPNPNPNPLQWRNIGTARPARGRELQPNAKLTAALSAAERAKDRGARVAISQQAEPY